MASECTQLSSLDLRGCNVTDEAVVAVASNCKQLTTLDRMFCRNITDAAVVAVASGCPLLTTLKLFLCSKITDEAVVTIAKPLKGARAEACHAARRTPRNSKSCFYTP